MSKAKHTTNKHPYLTHLIALVVFVLISCIYFYPQFAGKEIPQSDILQFKGMSHEMFAYQEETGIETLWTNAMFSGMPTYQISVWPDGNKISWLENAFNLFIPRPAGYFIFAQIAFYILLLLLGVDQWVAIPLAIAFAFTTNNIGLFDAGHTSKLRTLFSVPLVIGGVILTFRRKYLIGGALFCAGLTLNIFTNHFQITYYLALCLGILILIELIRAIRANTWKQLFPVAGVLVLGGILAVVASGYILYSTYQYSEDTMRGKPTLEQTVSTPTSSSQTDGLEWDYAMRWSNGTADLLASIIPRGAGGGSSEAMPAGSQWNSALRKIGVPPQNAPLYWGALPFTSGPVYMGATVIFLFFLGLLLVRSHLKWWLAGAVLFTVLLSMGKNFSALSSLFFDYFPLYNKFRAPSSILTITALFVPLLGALGISKFFSQHPLSEEQRRKWLWSYGIVGGFILLMALLGPSLFNFSGPSDAQLSQNTRLVQAGLLDALKADRRALFRIDAIRSFVYVTILMGILFAMQRKWIRKGWLAAGLIGVVVIADLWGIDRRYISANTFVPERQIESNFTPDAADQKILQDKDLYYRVHDLTVDPFNNSHRAYFHHMIGGYHAAKLQRYQDIIERYLVNNNQNVLNMLNTRYFIVPGDDGKPVVRRNLQALGNAWFVEGIRVVDTPEEEIAALADFDPKADAIVSKEFESLVKGFDPSKNGTIELTSYAPNKLTYHSSSLSDQLAVFSEIWYGPDKGWHAYIDGQPAKLVRADYVLRALNIPEGDHEIMMEFRPHKYYILKTIATIVSLLILAGLIFAVYAWIKKYNTREAPPLESEKQLKKERKGKSKQ